MNRKPSTDSFENDPISKVVIKNAIPALIANREMSFCGDMFVAGYGVTAKVIMVVSFVGIGMGSGAQPFFGYCCGAGKKNVLPRHHDLISKLIQDQKTPSIPPIRHGGCL